jgi:hypothetical protein
MRGEEGDDAGQGVLLDSACFECPWEMLRLGFNGLVVMISVLHTEGLRFDPGLNHFLLLFGQINCRKLLRALTTYRNVIFLKPLEQKRQ